MNIEYTLMLKSTFTHKEAYCPNCLEQNTFLSRVAFLSETKNHKVSKSACKACMIPIVVIDDESMPKQLLEEMKTDGPYIVESQELVY